MIRKPPSSEYNPFYETYIKLIEEDDMVKLLANQLDAFSHFVSGIDEQMAGYAYGSNKWTVAGVLNHINDVERIFTYRALCIARGEKQPLPGMNENEYQANTSLTGRHISDLLEEFVAIRTSTIFLYKYMPESDSLKTGVASGTPVTVRALAAMTYGHCQHHKTILETKYL